MYAFVTSLEHWVAEADDMARQLKALTIKPDNLVEGEN